MCCGAPDSIISKVLLLLKSHEEVEDDEDEWELTCTVSWAMEDLMVKVEW